MEYHFITHLLGATSGNVLQSYMFY